MARVKIGTGSYKEKFQENLDYCISQFDVLELQDFIMPGSLDNPALIKEYQEMLAGFDGEITLHGPYLNLAPTSIDRLVKGIAELRYLHGIEAAQKIGANKLVIHSFYDTTTGYSEYDSLWLEENIKFWSKFLEKVKGSGVTILLENVYDRYPDTFAELIAALDCPYLATCIDIGHANCLSDFKPREWIEKAGNYYFHISDNNGMNDGHRNLGCGNIDLQGISRELAGLPEVYLISEINEDFEKQYQSLQEFRGMVAGHLGAASLK